MANTASPLLSGKTLQLVPSYGGTGHDSIGLTSAEVKDQMIKYGPNELEADAKVSFLSIFVLQLKNVFFLMTTVASVICFLTGDQLKGRFFLGLVMFVCFCNALGEYSGQDAAAELKAMNRSMSVVVRDGREQKIESQELVPDDIVIVMTGDIVAADIQVIEIIEADLQTNEAVLTGEPNEKTKTLEPKEDTGSAYKSNMLYKGTSVVCGKGKGIVLTTGMRTEVGLIAKNLPAGEKDVNPLQISINILGNRIMMACFVVIMIGSTASVVLEYQMLPPKCQAHDTSCLILDSVLRGLLMAVAIIPHGLPLVVMVMLRVAAKGMYDRNGIVTRQTAVDYLGAANFICTDKTGTLTEGRMAAKEFTGLYRDSAESICRQAIVGFYPLKGLNPQGRPYPNSELSTSVCNRIDRCYDSGEDPAKITDLHDLSKPQGSVPENILAQAVLAAAFLNVGDPEKGPKIEKKGKDGWNCVGNMSDAAVKVAAMKAGYYYEASEAVWEQTAEAMSFRDLHKIKDTLAFNSKRKMSATIHSMGQEHALKTIVFANDVTHYAIVKGAPDKLFPSLSAVLQLENGQLVLSQKPATDADRKAVEQRNKELSDQALRTIIMAIRPLKKMDVDRLDVCKSADEKMQLLLEAPLALLCLWAIYDPPRSTVRHSIELCHQAGIEVVMITGDQPSTALAIGEKVGITKPAKFSKFPALKEGDVCKHCSDLHMSEIERKQSEADGLSPTRSLRVHDTKSKDDSHEKTYKDDVALQGLTKQVRMWARAMPSDKLTIVQSLQQQGMVTAMTGDGVNDAPALQHADIGVAMGISGTAVTRNAAALILMDDNFSTIVEAIGEGRKIYGNLQKYVLFNLSVKASECLCILTAILCGFCIPIQGMQQLANLLFTHIIPPMSLAWEDAEWYTMRLPPRDTKTDLILNRMHILYRWLPFVVLYAVIIMTHLNLSVWMNTGFVKVHALVGSARAGAVQAGMAACEIAGHLDDGKIFIGDPAPFHCRCEVRHSLWQHRPEIRDQWGKFGGADEEFDRWSGSAGHTFDLKNTPFANTTLLHPCADVNGIQRMCWNNPASTPPLLGIRNNCAEAGGRIGITMGYTAVQLGEILSLVTFRTDCFFAFAKTSRSYLGMLVLNLTVLMCILYVPMITDFLDLAPLDHSKLAMAVVPALLLLFTAEGIKAVYNQSFKSHLAVQDIFPDTNAPQKVLEEV